MARGISIGEVTNKLTNVRDNAVLPVSSGETVPQVVEVGALREYINEEPTEAIDSINIRMDNMEVLTISEIDNLLNI